MEKVRNKSWLLTSYEHEGTLFRGEVGVKTNAGILKGTIVVGMEEAT